MKSKPRDEPFALDLRADLYDLYVEWCGDPMVSHHKVGGEAYLALRVKEPNQEGFELWLKEQGYQLNKSEEEENV